MPSKVYKTGIIGYGYSAKTFHIPFIQSSPSFTLHSIVQRHPTASNSASTDHPTAKIYTSTTDLLADRDVDIVVITTQHLTHHDLALQVMKAGKHVLVEKPFTDTSAQARELAAVAKENGVMLTVYQNRRYDSDFLTLKSLLEQDKLGRVVEFETHFDRHRPDMPAGESWKTKPSDYSAVYDLGTHLMDQVVSIYGLPERVTGFVGTQRGERNKVGLEDSFTALLHYPKGFMAVAKAAVVSPENKQLRFWVRGEKGSFKKFFLDPQEEQLKAGLGPGKDEAYSKEEESRFGVLTTVKEGGEMSEETVPTVGLGGYTAFYDQFAKALDAGDEKLLPVTPGVAADVIRLVELVRESSREGRTMAV